MDSYTCPTCGEKIDRNLIKFIKHTDQHVLDSIKKKNPQWVTKDGFCHKCLEYYKKNLKK